MTTREPETDAPPHPDTLPNLRSAQKELTHRRLVEAGRTLFETRGYALVTVDEIADAAGTSRATFYLHFRTKLALLIEIRDEIWPSMVGFYRELDRVLADGSRDSVREAVDRSLEWLDANGRLMPAWDEAAATEPGYRDVLHGAYGELIDAMVLYQARWPPEEVGRARFRLELLIMQVERVFIRWIVQHALETDREAVCDALAEIWFSVLRIEPKGRSDGHAGPGPR